MQLISLFSGIGGFELAAEWMGWQNIVSCEINPFGRKVLEHYWPDAYHHDDIHTLTYEKIKHKIDPSTPVILTGGFPCQPYSAAGKRLGKEDERHLWPEMLRIIREVKPTWIVGENVLGLVNWNGGLVFNEVQTDLEAEGYEVQPYVLPAAGVGAPHRRDRVWFVAYANGLRGDQEYELQKTKLHKQYGEAEFTSDTDLHGLQQRNGNYEEYASQGRQYAQRDTQQSYGNGHAADANGNGLQGCISADFNQQQRSAQINASQCIPAYGAAIPFQNFPTQSPICTGDDGISTELDGITFSKWRNESIKAAGNAIVPQVVYQIFKCIDEYKNLVSL